MIRQIRLKNFGWRRVALWLLLTKAIYLTLVYAAISMWPSMDETYRSTIHWPRESEPVLGSHFATWDGSHYLYLSEIGYSKGAPACAFYPLWPLTIRWFSVFTGGSHLIAGILLANVFSLVAWMIFYHVVSERFGEPVALWSLVLLIAFPGSLFYQFIYTEPIFFLLVMLLWFGLEKERYDVAWIAACLLPLCRPSGIFCLLPIAWHLLTKRPLPWFRRIQGWWFRRRGKASPGQALANSSVKAQNAVHSYSLLLAPLLGWAAYFELMESWTGNPFEGFQAQRYWGIHSITNLINVPKFLLGLFTPTEIHAYTGSMLDRFIFIVLLYTLPLIWRLGKDLLVWTYLLAIVPAMSGTFTSFTRYESPAFPMFIALAVFFVGRKRRWPLIAFLILSAVLHGILVWRFVNFRWAG